MGGIVAGAVGAGIGFVVGGPVGAQAGWIAGSLLYSVLDPPKSVGPRRTDLKVQDSSFGLACPKVWGNRRIAGNLIWRAAKFTEHEHENSGKGGPEVTTFSYSLSFAIRICVGPIDDIGRIYHNSQLRFDPLQGSIDGDLPFVLYRGTETQMPDPTIEAHEGVGNVGANRGVAYVVFTELELPEQTIGQWEFEVVTHGAPDDFHRVSTFDTPIDTSVGGSVNYHKSISYDGTYIYVGRFQGHGPTPPVAAEEYESSNAGLDPVTFGNDSGVWYIARYTEAGVVVPWTDDHGLTFNEKRFYVQNYNYPGVDPPPVMYIMRIIKCREDPFVFIANWFDGDVLVACLFYTVGRDFSSNNGGAVSPVAITTGFGHPTIEIGPQFTCMVEGGVRSYYILFSYGGDCVVTRRGAAATPYTITGFGGGGNFQIFCDQTTQTVWVTTGGTDGNVWKFTAALELLHYYVGVTPVRVSAEAMFCGDRLIATELGHGGLDAPYYVVARQIQDAAPWPVISRIPFTPGDEFGGVYDLRSDGLCLVDDGLFAGCERTQAAAVALSEIVRDLSVDYAHLTEDQIDVSELDDLVWGYAVASQMPVRNAIDELRNAYFFDAVESDGLIKFVKRGGASKVTISDDDLSAHSDGGELPPLAETVRIDEWSLPRRVYVTAINKDADDQDSTQHETRSTTLSEMDISINLAISMTVGEMKAIARKQLYGAWNSRMQRTLKLPPKFKIYEPTDVITARGYELQIIDSVAGADGVLTVNCVNSSRNIYAESGVGASSSAQTGQTLTLPQTTELAMIDGPFIGSDAQQGLVPVVMQGAVRRSYKGGDLEKAPDGVTYASILIERVAGTIGVTQTALGNYGGDGFDEENVLSVLIPPGGGQLANVSRDAALAGANMALVGADDDGVRGEIINFKNAPIISEDDAGTVYAVSGMLRGRHGSRPFMAGHTIGDKFIVLPANSSVTLLRSDLGVARDYKAPTIGSALSTATVYPFRSNGLPFAAFAPIFVRAGFTGDPGSSDILIEWNRCSRVSQGWLNFRAQTGVGPPLGEETEGYRVRFYADGTKQTIVKAYTDADGITTPRFVYTVAMQTTDFGGALSVLPSLNVAQKCSIGWGWDSDGGKPQFVPSVVNYVPPNPPLDDPRRIDSTIAWSEVATVSQALGPDDIWAIEIPIGSIATGSIPVLINAAEFFSDPPTGRIWALSATRGDFGPQGHTNAWSHDVAVPTVTAQFFVGAGAYGAAAWPTFPASSTVYLNIKTAPTGYPSVGMFATIKRIPT